MATIAGGNGNLKKGNKENTRPTTMKRGTLKPVSPEYMPLNSKNNIKETDSAQREDTLKGKTGQSSATAGQGRKRQTLSQAFHSAQAVRQRKLVAEAQKPAATMPPKPALGTYKGRVVQSKIGALWKSSSTSLEGEADRKAVAGASATGDGNQKRGDSTKVRSKSIADLPRWGAQKPPRQPSRSKSVADRTHPVSKCPAVGQALPSRSIGHTARTASSGSLARPSSSRSVTSSRSEVSQSGRPPVSSSLSQYRTSMESAEERRAKLAEWLSFKGKTLKRPPITSTAPPKARPVTSTAPPKARPVTSAAPPKARPVKESAVHPPSQSVPEQGSVAPARPAVQPDLGLDLGLPAAAPRPGDTQGPAEENPACSSTPQIMNTTLDLLDNSDVDLPADPEARMDDDIVLNLCDALEALGTSFASVDDDCKPNDEEQEESPEAGEKTVKKEPSSGDAVGGASDDLTQTPEMDGASMVKYSVKTTPFLQRVKKTIEGESSGQKKKGAIKDLKFLTPVRRSCRLQRSSSCRPEMLTDHDPCVTSLAELVQLDDAANAYIYRKNPALLAELPDLPRDLERI